MIGKEIATATWMTSPSKAYRITAIGPVDTIPSGFDRAACM